MPRLEIEHLAVAALPRAAGTERLAAGEPADENRFIRRGDTERLAVGLLRRQLEIRAQPLRDRMPRRGDPDALQVVALAPDERAGGAHKPHEGLGFVRGVKEYRAHAAQHFFLYQRGDLLRHVAVRHVSPPHEHVGIAQALAGDFVYGFKRYGIGGKIGLRVEQRRQLGVDAVRVDIVRAARGILLVQEFVIDEYAEHAEHLV